MIFDPRRSMVARTPRIASFLAGLATSLVFSIFSQGALAQQLAPASIAGQAVTRPGGEPAAGAKVQLVVPVGQAGRELPTEMTVTSSGDGSFRFDNVALGTYLIRATAQGFMPGEYGQRSPTGRGLPVTVAAGQKIAGVRIAMAPTGSISGRVVDGDGDPLGRVQVLALKVVYQDGRQVTTIAQSVLTNDRGEYRFFWLPPGQYRVAAKAWDAATRSSAVYIAPPKRVGTFEQGTGPVVGRRTLENGQVMEHTDVPVYLPGTTDAQTASILSLASGANATGADIQLAGNRVPTYHVRGTVLGARGQPVAMTVAVVPRTPGPSIAIPVTISRSDGSFDVGGVPAGSYFVFESGGAAFAPLDVNGADVDVTLDMAGGVDIPGRITFDRGASSGSVPNPSALRITLSRDPDVLGTPTAGPRFNPPPAADGSFTLSGIGPGDYRVSVPPMLNRSYEGGFGPGTLLQNAYVKSIRWGSADVLAGGLHVWGRAQGTLEIVVGLNGADVTGTVLDARAEPVANVIVAVVPDANNRFRSDLYKTASTDSAGHFHVQGLAPGDYTLLSWDDVEEGAWQNPEFIRAWENRGRFVRLREGTNDPIELNVITSR